MEKERDIASGMGQEELIKRSLIGQAQVIEGDLKRLEAALDCLAQDVKLTPLDDTSQLSAGSIHALYTPAAMAGYIRAAQPVRAQGWYRDRFSVVMPLSGRIRVTQYPTGRVVVNGPILILPGSEQHWQLSRDCELLVFRFRPPAGRIELLQGLFRDSGRGCDTELVEQVKAFMQRLPARLHLGLREHELKRRLGVLRAELLSLFGLAEQMDPEPLGEWPLDRRVERVAQRLQTLPHDCFDLGELSELAHMSQRGLYYAFKRNLDCTPYQYFKACQLVRVRIALLQDPERRHSISWHAYAHGFQHMSRFSAQYRRHFGENPSETVARVVQQGASQLPR